MDSFEKSSLPPGLDVKIPALSIEGKMEELLAKPIVLKNLWLQYATKIVDQRIKSLKKAIKEYSEKAKVSVGGKSGKKRFGNLVKKLKRLEKALETVVSGSRFMRLFGGKKDIAQTLKETTRNLFPIYRFHPQQFQMTSKELLDASKKMKDIDPMIGDFQTLMRIYASIWVAESRYIDTLANKLFWKGVTNNINIKNGSSSLEDKITKNLQTMAKKKGEKDQKAIIRSAIVEDVVPLFNQSIRLIMGKTFEVFKNDEIVFYDEKAKEWYITIGKLPLTKKCLKYIFRTMPFLSFHKSSDDTIEVRYMLSEFNAPKRIKESQSIQVFIRRAVLNQLNKNEFKALNFFGDLNEKYIGKSAANTFYSYTRLLGQMILSPLESD
jgi:hypothetical protein